MTDKASGKQTVDSGRTLSPEDSVRKVLGGLPSESRMLDAILAALPPGLEIAGVVAGAGGLVGVPGSLANLLSEWMSNGRQKEVTRRLSYCMRVLVREIERLESTHLDGDWALLMEDVLPRALLARSEEKRKRYMILLAKGAGTESSDLRDEARTMSTILDQLEYVHVAVFDRLMRKPTTQNYGTWGGERTYLLEQGDLQPKNAAAALFRLEAVGLLKIADTATRSTQSLNKKVHVNTLGIRFHAWVGLGEDA